ncbi:FHA domain-containing protein [uncultured Eubacterium sp.]|uniref:FHA domain-containing protein n=1 Tax=uncultured Eubacterium sp. TaxID=165185 RepID=UPI00267142A3|nr:FHA domain-containing protein [uncultured Eubacterium sp.]
MAKNNIERVYEIEDLIKKYNKKPEKKVKKKDIVKLLQNAEIIMAAKAVFEDCQVYEEMLDGISLHPDIVKDGARARLLPVFTSYEQIPVDYMNSFSLIRIQAMDAYTFMNECDDLDGMVLNPFTEAHLELKKKKDFSKKTITKHYKKDIVSNQPEAMIIHNNKKYLINKSPFTIGRENANIVIPQTYISQIHVVISFKDGKYRVADYDSTNGTRVNGTLLKPKIYYELRDGYIIELSEKEKMVVYIN